MSRRYLRVLLRWIPYGGSVFNEWPVRPRCGHFFGGVLWYCQDTAMPAFALAEGHNQWAAQLADHLPAADSNASEPKRIKAAALRAMADKLLTATGRNYYLTSARELEGSL